MTRRTERKNNKQKKNQESRTKICGAVNRHYFPAGQKYDSGTLPRTLAFTCLLMEDTGSTWLLVGRVPSS